MYLVKDWCFYTGKMVLCNLLLKFNGIFGFADGVGEWMGLYELFITLTYVKITYVKIRRNVHVKYEYFMLIPLKY